MLFIEDFNNDFDKEEHWKKHRKDFPKYKDADEYEKRANYLACQKPNKSDSKKGIVGYVRFDGRRVYYNYNTKEYLIWKLENNKPLIVSYYTVSPRQYEYYRDYGTDGNGELSKMKRELSWNK